MGEFDSSNQGDILKTLFWDRLANGFDDRIVKDEKSLDKINQYIINNPIFWHKDLYYQR
jgi:hypothetical protein